MGFGNPDGYTVTRTWEPNFGPSGTSISSDWDIQSPATTPQDVSRVSDIVAHDPQTTGDASYPNTYGIFYNADDFTSTANFAISASIKPPASDVIIYTGSTTRFGLMDSSYNLLFGIRFTGNFDFINSWNEAQYTTDGSSFTTFADSRTDVLGDHGGTYYRLGLRKLGTTLSIWGYYLSGYGTSSADTSMTQWVSTTVTNPIGTYGFGFIFDDYLRSFAGIDLYNLNDISDIKCYEFALTGGGGGGTPTVPPLSIPPGISIAPTSILIPTILSMPTIEDTTISYHKYKSLLHAVDIYNHLKLR